MSEAQVPSNIIDVLKTLVAEVGAEWGGVQETVPPMLPLLLFTSPTTHTTLAVPINPGRFVCNEVRDAITFRLIASTNEFAKRRQKMPTLTLLEKLHMIYDIIDHIEKRGHNKAQNYDFIRSADVTRELRHQFSIHRIYAEINFDFAESNYTIAREKAPNAPFTAANVKCSMIFHDLDSKEVTTGSGLGSGCDTSDKAVYKAQTGALKYALKNSFLIPDEADAEADETVDGGTQNSIPDDMPDFQEAKHDTPKAGTKKATRPTAAPAATAGASTKTQAAPSTPAPTSVPAANKPDETALAPKAEPATQSTISNTSPNSGSPTTTSPAASQPLETREPGDESERPPTEEELNGYRKAFQKLGDDLSAEGGLKSSPKLPIERKVLVFLLGITKAAGAKDLTKGQWDAFFARVEAAKANEQVGLIGLATLINKANGIEPKVKATKK